VSSMQHVGLRPFDEAMQRQVAFIDRCFMGEDEAVKLAPRRRRAPYPRSTPPKAAKPVNDLAALAEILADTYDAVTLWRCNGYEKLQRGGRVWIIRPDRSVPAPGHGNRAKRRMGWRTTWRRTPTRRTLVWVRPDGTVARKVRKVDGWTRRARRAR
jgi:hypothetical protein